MRDVVVIGWGRPGEKRVSFIKLIRDELALGLADAKVRFEALLGEGAPVVIPASTPRSFELAREIRGLGGEVRVLSGHANARVQGLLANEELADIRRLLEDLGEHVAARDWMRAIESVRPDLAVAPEDDRKRLTGYQLARANCGAVAHYHIEPQPETDWTGNLPLPGPLAGYYEKLGPVDLSLEALGNPYCLPALKNLR